MSEDNDPLYQPQTVFRAQLYFCTVLGLLIFFLFCFVRYRFPLVYGIRSYRNKRIRPLPDNLFGWIRVLYLITDDEILQLAGLDSYVFLRFFKMCIIMLATLALFALGILSPIRYLLTGSFDKDYPEWVVQSRIWDTLNKKEDPFAYLLVCTIFTYVFTGLVYYFLFKETTRVIRTRQRCLGNQKSLTDRTILISNIPSRLNNDAALRAHVEALGVGTVESITIVRDYSALEAAFEERAELVRKLELGYSQYYGLDIRILRKNEVPSTTLRASGDSVVLSGGIDRGTEILGPVPSKKRPTTRLGGLFSTQVDVLDYYAHKLVQIDAEILELKQRDDFKLVNDAFVTLDSVSDAQMAAQAVLSPNVFQLITRLAPAPRDVNWSHFLLSAKEKFVRTNAIELTCLVFSALLIIPIRYITPLLNVESIRKMWPDFGDYLIKHELLRTLVTGLLPTYLFTLINVVLPYIISFLSNLQGLVSKGDAELGIIRKNFLYIFFNLFLVFTLFGTFASYKALLSDTTKIAPVLAASIKRLSLFYVDLIILQGLTMFPFKLLQVGDIFLVFWQYVMCFRWQTPRDYRDLFYKPAIFEVGLILPQHILIFIITLIYSVISTKIVTSGLAYFVIGFYTYKYQLVYSMVHIRHSTGKAWPIIFKRVCLGVVFFHLTMLGTLALERAYILAILVVPLLPTTIMALVFFDRNYLPLLYYIALDAIKTSGESVEAHDFDDTAVEDSVVYLHTPTPSLAPEQQPLLERSLRKRRSTIDEEREEFQNYTHPCLADQMDGPWIGFVGDYIDTVQYYIAVEHGSESEIDQLDQGAEPITSVIIRKKTTTVEYD
ncbi:unnamed protein product [Kuraishia capsulata CBS 1993]|uniref:DUF221-domain-containing protein n=1 Tax=Kuraishia capsulata CBS 1993 TaxID=1382522 RepID=W6MSN4_9ASCO|nr:uncharacterized protein KUCA_T00005815001 [Kuraishia capsulata CBS 1993]CDK29821.1 unnamed protein product [Kuraishia capsulata CBS 1993]